MKSTPAKRPITASFYKAKSEEKPEAETRLFPQAMFRRAATFRFVCSLCLIAGAMCADDLDDAYRALSAKDYDRAIVLFRSGVAQHPEAAAAHKDLAYTLLKTGDDVAARDEFQAALTISARDDAAALEFAFLAFETGKPVEARRMFDRLRTRGLSSATRTTAEQAFQNIDKPLAQGIALWQQSLAQSSNPMDPSLYSVHLELARLAEQRDNLPLAAAQFEICRKLKPHDPVHLLDLARVWMQLNRVEDARAALLAASRSVSSRVAETALEE